MKLTLRQVGFLVNKDGLLCKKPFRNAFEERQYYGRYLNQRLWKYLKKSDWKRLKVIIDDIRIPERTKDATKWLIKKHLRA
jgi:hypothetical protein